ncbi:MAG: deoxyribodipyrimidine photolyase [Actinomycetota bacterium]|nr:deoxyribodipyrimidine photolyase [Actinomycetota bacterium]
MGEISIPPSPVRRDVVANRQEVESWVRQHLSGLYLEEPEEAHGSSSFFGGQDIADKALETLDITGYASKRSRVAPEALRGATRLSPYIRHGLLTLPEVWQAVKGGSYEDLKSFRNELLWQDYSRHLYNFLGRNSQEPIRYELSQIDTAMEIVEVLAYDEDMECLRRCNEELRESGWLVNQTRMWMASHHSIREGQPFDIGEDEFFRHLLDGSRAANRLGWQWVAGTLTGRPYGFSRSQVTRQAPQWCNECALRSRCPIDTMPDSPEYVVRRESASLRIQEDLGPKAEIKDGPDADCVWLTAELLSLRQSALVQNPNLPAVFVFDRALLGQLRLSFKRLVFLAETLFAIGAERTLELHVGDPTEVLSGRRIAATWTPVPGWKKRQKNLNITELHPWPWLCVSKGVISLGSFSAWSKAAVFADGRRHNFR